jgi:hypothetical protein
MDDAEIDSLILRGAELKSLDYKQALHLRTAPSAVKAEVVRDLMAFHNSGGGTIILGVNERPDKAGFDLVGCNTDEAGSWDPTKIQDQTLKWSSCPIPVEVLHRDLNGRHYVVLVIRPFTRSLAICKAECQGVLRNATIYIRTDGATTEPIQSAHHVEQLIDMCVRARRDEFLAALLPLSARDDKAGQRTLSRDWAVRIHDATLQLGRLPADDEDPLERSDWGRIVCTTHPVDYEVHRYRHAELIRALREPPFSAGNGPWLAGAEIAVSENDSIVLHSGRNRAVMTRWVLKESGLLVEWRVLREDLNHITPDGEPFELSKRVIDVRTIPMAVMRSMATLIDLYTVLHEDPVTPIRWRIRFERMAGRNIELMWAGSRFTPMFSGTWGADDAETEKTASLANWRADLTQYATEASEDLLSRVPRAAGTWIRGFIDEQMPATGPLTT